MTRNADEPVTLNNVTRVTITGTFSKTIDVSPSAPHMALNEAKSRLERYAKQDAFNYLITGFDLQP